MSIVALYHLSTGCLIRTYHVPVVFGVELAGAFGRSDQVTKHDGKLPSFRVGRRCSKAEFNHCGMLCLGSRWLCWLSRLRDEGGRFPSVPSPHEDSAIFIRGELLCLDDLRLEGFEILVV